jgi:hypothetical protein
MFERFAWRALKRSIQNLRSIGHTLNSPELLAACPPALFAPFLAALLRQFVLRAAETYYEAIPVSTKQANRIREKMDSIVKALAVARSKPQKMLHRTFLMTLE